MCPHCRAFITTKDKVCPYCEAEVGPRAIERRDPAPIAGGLISGQRFLTSMILLINIGLYALCVVYGSQDGRSNWMGIDGRTLIEFGSKFGPNIILQSEYWRLITAGFLHGGAFHILMNSWYLLDLGSQVEEIYGVARMIVIYVMGTVLGFTASLFYSPLANSVGASAGICGLLGAMIAYATQSQSSYARAMKGAYIRWAILILALGLLPFPIDNAAHIGGMAGGYAIGYLAGTPRLTSGFVEQFWKVAAGISVGLVVISFAFWASRFF